jgi:hypothetical protein
MQKTWSEAVIQQRIRINPAVARQTGKDWTEWLDIPAGAGTIETERRRIEALRSRSNSNAEFRLVVRACHAIEPADEAAAVPGFQPLSRIAETFAAAKDAPTSFEDEQWLEGFEDSRQMIAGRLALDVPEPERPAFLAACLVNFETETAE